MMTGKPPFHYYPIDATVIMGVVRGERPERPKEEECEDTITDELWELFTKCWANDPAERTVQREVVKTLTQMCAAEKPLRLLSIGKE